MRVFVFFLAGLLGGGPSSPPSSTYYISIFTFLIQKVAVGGGGLCVCVVMSLIIKGQQPLRIGTYLVRSLKTYGEQTNGKFEFSCIPKERGGPFTTPPTHP